LSDYQIVCIIIFIPARFVECQAGFNNEYIFYSLYLLLTVGRASVAIMCTHWSPFLIAWN